MRIIVFFDLPTNTKQELTAYRKFHKHLIKSGFMMLQKSVYSKVVLNPTVVESVKTSLRAKKPEEGSVVALVIPEKYYSGMEYIVGTKLSNVLDSDERFIVL